jgi:hypothetical protein
MSQCMHRSTSLHIHRLQARSRRDSWLRLRRTGVNIVRSRRSRVEFWAHMTALLLPKVRSISDRRDGDGPDRSESSQLLQSPVITQLVAGAFDFKSRLKSKDLKWGDWQRQEIEGDALVLPLMIITFSCAYVISLGRIMCSIDNSLADAITLERYSTFATSMTG